MRLVAVGISHRSAAVEVRERLGVAPGDLPDLLASLKRVAGVEEAVLLSTCNRTEIYAAVGDEGRDAARLQGFLAELAKVPLAELGEHLYIHSGEGAIRHVFRVAASLDSMMLGEAQILGQVKAAVAAARAAELTQRRLVRLFDRAFALAKRVRTETAIGESSVSVSSAAVDLARTIFGPLAGRTVLIIGAGKMGRVTLRHLHGAGVRSVLLANRGRERAELLLEGLPDLAARYVPLEELGAAFELADIALSSVQAGRFLLDREEARKLQGRRRGRPLLLVDIAVPRSLDPAVHEVDNVFLYDIDDLQGVIEDGMRGRLAAAAEAEKLVDGEVRSFVSSLREGDVAPTIRELVSRFEEVRLAEVERHRGRIAEVNPEVAAAIDALTRGIVNKLAHGAITELRRLALSAEGEHGIEALRRALLVSKDKGQDGDET